MRVTCEVVGEGTHDLELEADATYSDVLEAVGLSRHEPSTRTDASCRESPTASSTSL